MFYLGVDVGGMSVKVGLVGEDGKLMAKASLATNAVGRTEEFIQDIVSLCDAVLDANGYTREDVISIGLGLPGTVDAKRGVVTYACNIAFRDVQLAASIKKLWDIPVYLANDADAAAFGEVKFGAGKGMTDALLVTLGTGVGTGLILDGKIFSGRNGAGGEAGHTVLVMDGELCSCGRRGCFEAYASASALIRMTKKAVADHPEGMLATMACNDGISGKTVFNAYKKGDTVATLLVEQYAKAVAEGITNLVNIFRPQLVMLGGGVSGEGEYFVKMIEERVNRYAYGREINPYVEFGLAALGNDAGVIGAAALGMK